MKAARPRRRGDAGRDVDALRVDPHRPRYDTAGGQHLAGQGIAGVLDPGLAAGRQQDAHDEIEGMLRARCDDLLGVAAHAARAGEIGGDGAAQLGRAARIAIAQMALGMARKVAHSVVAMVGGALVDQRAAEIERAVVAQQRDVDLAGKPRRAVARGAAGLAERGASTRSVGQVRRHVGARADAAGGVAASNCS